MMSFTSISDRLSKRGYRKNTTSRFILESGGLEVIDYNHRKKPELYSVYIDKYGSVEYVEKSAVKWSESQHRYVPVVTKISNLTDFIKSLA